MTTPHYCIINEVAILYKEVFASSFQMTMSEVHDYRIKRIIGFFKYKIFHLVQLQIYRCCLGR
jgi:hypothetical protein